MIEELAFDVYGYSHNSFGCMFPWKSLRVLLAEERRVPMERWWGGLGVKQALRKTFKICHYHKKDMVVTF